jgi:ankyrin repeat protein
VLHIAAASSEAALIPLLIAARAPVDGVNTHGDTALMLGVKSRCLACAKSLLSAGASTRVRNGDGLTAKDIARLSTDQTLIQLLD